MSCSVSRFFVRLALLATAAAVIPACGKGSGDGTPAPSGLLSGLEIHCKGGTGTSGVGGDGAYFDVEAFGGDLRILSSGIVNSAFTCSVVKPNLGSNPLIVSTSQSITPVIDPDTLDKDKLMAGGQFATGLWIKPGATLTVAESWPDTVRLIFTNGVYIEGALTVSKKAGGASLSACDFWLSAENLVVATSGLIDTSGADGVNAGSGGFIDADIDGTVINAGSIDTSGGNGSSSGGNGGYVDVRSSIYAVWNTGPVTTSGGTGTAASGGRGGNCKLAANGSFPPGSFWGGVFNSGDITTKGGDGATGGGDGGRVDIDANSCGVCLNYDAAIDSSAGSALSSGSGGDAGGIFFLSSGDMRVTGSLTSNGGNGAGGGDGGMGGWIYFEGTEGQVFGGPVGGSVAVGAPIEMHGGNGANGNWGGSIYAISPQVFEPDRGGLFLVGYSTIDLSGGDGATGGGDAYSVQLLSIASDPPAHVGSLINEAAIIARGGNSSSGAGGDGIDVEVLTESGSSAESVTRELRNSGSIDAGGGNGATSGGSGGVIYLYDYYRVVNTGALSSVGGNGTSGSGGSAGGVDISSESYVYNAGALTATGGNSTAGSGGAGGAVALYTPAGFTGGGTSREVNNSGAITTSGGAGTTSGGTGGNVSLYDYYKAVNTGAITAVGGAGGSGSGGAGGSVALSSESLVLNCASITASGGAAATGGAGGPVNLFTPSSAYIGSIFNSGAITSVGGSGTSGPGGAGGQVQLYTWYQIFGPINSVPSYTRELSNSGSIVCSGGSGTTAGGNGGNVLLYEHYKLTNGGAITSNGGGGAGGGNGGAVTVACDWSVSQASYIATNGGAATSGSGGNGGSAAVHGYYVSVSGGSTSNGGNSIAGTGGNGGSLDVAGAAGLSAFSGSAAVQKGTGGTTPADGTVTIDGIVMELTGGQYWR